MANLPQKSQITLIALCVLCFLSPIQLLSQEVLLIHNANTSLYYTERSNWSTYRDGKYIGLTHREIRARLTPGEVTTAGRLYEGFFYKLQQTNRDTVNVAQQVDALFESRFTVMPNGTMTFLIDNGYPEYRNFPAFPALLVSTGDNWIADGIRSVDPLNNRAITDIPIIVQYSFIGEEAHNGESVWVINAKYATRYKLADNAARRDPELQSASGTHELKMLIGTQDGVIRLITDRLDETFSYRDGRTIRFKGNTAIYSNSAYASDILATKLEEAATTTAPSNDSGDMPNMDSSAALQTTEDEGKNKEKARASGPIETHWVTESTDRGVRLSIRQLNFIADSAELLPGESQRLDAIAEALLSIEQGQFLVEGHTAATGNPIGELKLSGARALQIINELCKRGLRHGQFIYKGQGGTVPIGDNSTSEGRAQNRRVEITVLN